MGCKQTNNRSVGVISVVWGVKAALTFFSTQRGGHLGHFRTTPRTHRATGVWSRDAGGRVSEPGLHGLSDLPLRSVFLWGEVTWLPAARPLSALRPFCSPTGALKTDHTEVLLSADFTGAIKVFINVKKYWGFPVSSSRGHFVLQILNCTPGVTNRLLTT